MHNRTMLSFHKNRDCPTSEELLAYRNGSVQTSALDSIGEHICSCDFCGAEAEFYSHFPHPLDDTISVTEIPDHLYELAEALLNNKRQGNKLLQKFVKENEQLALKKNSEFRIQDSGFRIQDSGFRIQKSRVGRVALTVASRPAYFGFLTVASSTLEKNRKNNPRQKRHRFLKRDLNSIRYHFKLANL